MENASTNTKSTFRAIAEQVVAGSPVSAGRTKISTADLIARFPDGVHLCAVDLFNGDNGQYAVFNITEDDAVYYPAGSILTSMVETYLAQNGGDLSALNDELKTNPLGVSLEMGKNKKGQQLVKVEIVD